MAIQLKSQNVTNMYTPIELVTTNIAVLGGGTGGVTDHGMLAGNLDNDHPQYQLTDNNSVILGPYQLTVNNSLSLGTGATASFEYTSQSTKFVAKTNSTLFANKTHIHGVISIASTSGTDLTYSSASDGLSLSVPNFITTGALSDHSHGAVNTVVTAGTNLTLASASDGLTVAVPAFITTAFGAAVQGGGTYSQNTGTIQFVNSNGVTFGLSNNGVMTASIAGSEIGVLGIADAVATITGGTVHFSNLNGLSLGLSGSTLTGSYTVPGATVFSNSNNVEFGLNGSTITALALVNQTLQTSNVHNVTVSGNTAGTMTEVSSGTMTLIGGSNITLSQSGNKISIIGEIQGGIQTGISGMVVSNTTYTSGSVYFSGQNNITLGSYVSSDSQYIRLSVGYYLTTAALSTHIHGSNISFGNTSNSTETAVRASSSSNGITMVVPSFLTTAMQSASSSVFAKTGFTTQSTAGTDIVGTLNTLGLALGVPKYITTAPTIAHTHSDYIGLASTGITGGTATMNSSQLMISIAPAGTLYFSDIVGFSFGSSVSGINTSIYIVTA